MTMQQIQKTVSQVRPNCSRPLLYDHIKELKIKPISDLATAFNSDLHLPLAFWALRFTARSSAIVGMRQPPLPLSWT